MELWSKELLLDKKDGLFVAISSDSNVVAYSKDGMNWNNSLMPSAKMWYGVTYGKGEFLAISYGNSAVAHSKDGVNWMETNLPNIRDWGDITYGNGRFVAVG